MSNIMNYEVTKELPGASVGDIIGEEPGDFMDQNLYKAGVDYPIVHRSQIDAAIKDGFIREVSAALNQQDSNKEGKG